MELLSFGLYLFSLVFLLFPFLCSWLLLGQFLLASFPSSFLSVVPVCFFPILFSSYCIYILSSFCFPPASILFIRRFRFPVWFCVLERSQNEGKNEGKIHDKQLGMNLGQEQANLLPHPATTATTTIATAGPSCAFAAGICLTSTSKAPTAPASPRVLLLLMQLLLMLMVLVLVAAGSCW